jgi:hypothetical protein
MRGLVDDESTDRVSTQCVAPLRPSGRLRQLHSHHVMQQRSSLEWQGPRSKPAENMAMPGSRIVGYVRRIEDVREWGSPCEIRR